ncbi:MAG: transcriptional regulator [Spirochaetes bacterium]|nr:transcriptional regulator [Spirochaetota bacterium]
MTGGRSLGGLELDRVIHEKARLMILSYLASSGEAAAGFTAIREGLGFTSGNLSVQLRNLEEAGYVDIEKSFRDNKPYTSVRLTVAGKDALERYLAELEFIVASLKGGDPKPDPERPRTGG